MISNVVSVFGAGFVGSEFCKQHKYIYVQDRKKLVPRTNNILFLISTIHNYNVFTDAQIDIQTNQIMLVAMLEKARNKFGTDFIVNFVSSWFVYGVTTLPAKEDNYCDPKGFYSITKRAAEQLLISYCETYKINYRILRLANVMGIGDKKASLKKNALQYIIKEVSQGRDVQTYKQASWRDFIDVRDCARAIILCITQGELDTIYNVGNGNALNVKEIIDYVRLKNGVTTPNEIDAPEFHAQVQTKEFWMDITKLNKLGYVPEYTIWETVDSLIDYYKNEI